MSSSKKYTLTAAIVCLLAAGLFNFFSSHTSPVLPLIGIANYGPHSSLDDTILGLKEELAKKGLIEGQNIQLEIVDVNFEPSLIPQMLAKLKARNPKVLVTLTTPVSQAAKAFIKNIPLVFSAITDPVEAGLLQNSSRSQGNMTGTSDLQDLKALLRFIKRVQPLAKTIGLLYATGEANDIALLKHMGKAAQTMGFQVIAYSVNQARDVPSRMHAFKGKVDLIYVGVSGPIQPALPTIVVAADKMNIPVYNADFTAVKAHQAFGSFGVNYKQVGVNTAEIVKQILEGTPVAKIPPSYPTSKDHKGFISDKKARQLGLSLPKDISNITVVE